MRFEVIANQLVNLEHVVRIHPETKDTAVMKSYEPTTQTIKTEVMGEPYLIRFVLWGGESLVMAYKSEVDRDLKFRQIIDGLAR